MMDSPCESESSLDGGVMLPPSPVSREQLQKRIESLTQQNKVLKVELETYKIRVKVIQEENRALRQASVIIQAKAEQEEEYISNTLLKKIQALKKEKETLAHHYEREEECLTNDLSRKLDQLRQEKCKLELTLEQEQECLVNKLMRKIEKLEAETSAKQNNLEQLRREMVELENTLEQEQEALVNKLWKRMDKLEAEKRSLQIKLDQPVSDPTSPKEIVVHRIENGNDTASQLTAHIQNLRSEVDQLRGNLAAAEKESQEKTQHFAQEEKCIRDENKRLQRKLQQEVERREALSRHLSESESSLEFEEERLFNENVSAFANSTGTRPLSPGGMTRCHTCGQLVGRRTSERFIKPAIPLGLNTSAPNMFHHHSAGGCVPAGGSNSTGGNFPMLSASNSGAPGACSSLNSSISSSSTQHNSSNVSFSGNTSFVQPASPMDTSMCKD